MATQTTLEALAQVHPTCLGVHFEVKELMSEKDARILLLNGFTDCSWGNDEFPSYYMGKKYSGDYCLMIIDDIDQEYNRVSNKIRYSISGYNVDNYIEFKSIDEAIKEYKRIENNERR